MKPASLSDRKKLRQDGVLAYPSDEEHNLILQWLPKAMTHEHQRKSRLTILCAVIGGVNAIAGTAALLSKNNASNWLFIAAMVWFVASLCCIVTELSGPRIQTSVRNRQYKIAHCTVTRQPHTLGPQADGATWTLNFQTGTAQFRKWAFVHDREFTNIDPYAAAPGAKLLLVYIPYGRSFNIQQVKLDLLDPNLFQERT